MKRAVKLKTGGLILLAVILSAALGFALLSRRGAAPPDPEPRSAPQFALKDYEGRDFGLADFLGTPVLVNGWASWCPYCKEELKDFSAVKKEFTAQGKEIAIIAVNRAESPEAARRYSDSLNLGGEIVFLLDPEDSFYKSIGGFSMPETVFIDAHGKIRYHKRGPMNREEIRRRIEDSF